MSGATAALPSPEAGIEIWMFAQVSWAGTGVSKLISAVALGGIVGEGLGVIPDPVGRGVGAVTVGIGEGSGGKDPSPGSAGVEVG